MNEIKALFGKGLKPSQVFRYLLENGICTKLSDCGILLSNEYDDIPHTVANTLSHWNRGGIPETAGQGLNDERLDELLIGQYGHLLYNDKTKTKTKTKT
ncbi:MAG: hypothetical protein ABJI60_00765 [Kangiellaceae bacterium]